MSIPVITETEAEPTNENMIDEHEVDDNLRAFIKNEIFLVTERAHYFEAEIEDKFRVLFEMSKILDKKMACLREDRRGWPEGAF